jgi:hypothetical protein
MKDEQAERKCPTSGRGNAVDAVGALHGMLAAAGIDACRVATMMQMRKSMTEYRSIETHGIPKF